MIGTWRSLWFFVRNAIPVANRLLQKLQSKCPSIRLIGSQIIRKCQG